MLTTVEPRTKLLGMNREYVVDLSLDVIAAAVKAATQQAAREAVKAGRVVTGMKDGRIVQYGAGHLPLPEVTEEVSDVRAA